MHKIDVKFPIPANLFNESIRSEKKNKMLPTKIILVNLDLEQKKFTAALESIVLITNAYAMQINFIAPNLKLNTGQKIINEMDTADKIELTAKSRKQNGIIKL